MGAVFLFIYISIYLSIYSFWECSGSDLSIYPWCPHQGQKHTHVDLGACCMVICSMGTLANPFASRGDHGDLMGGTPFLNKVCPKALISNIYLSIYLFTYLSTYLSIHLPIYLSVLGMFCEWPVYLPLVSPPRGEAYPCRFGWTLHGAFAPLAHLEFLFASRGDHGGTPCLNKMCPRALISNIYLSIYPLIYECTYLSIHSESVLGVTCLSTLGVPSQGRSIPM